MNARKKGGIGVRRAGVGPNAQAKDSKQKGVMSSDLVLEVRGLPPRRARGRKVRRGRVFGRDAVAVVRTVEREHK